MNDESPMYWIYAYLLDGWHLSKSGNRIYLAKHGKYDITDSDLAADQFMCKYWVGK
jgi:hypothetical protein